MILVLRVQLNDGLFLNVLGDVSTLGHVQELTALLGLVPLDPGVLAVIETSKGGIDDFERLRLLANSNNHTRLHLERRDVDYLAVDGDVLVTHELAGSGTRRGDAQTEDDVVKAALQQLQQHLTGDAVGLGSLLKQVTELALKNTIGVLSLLLLCQHDCILRLLAATVLAMLSRGEVPTGQNFVRAEDSISEAAGNF